MRQRRARSDDVLFISALAAILLGLGLLLYTTGMARGIGKVWPVLIIAVGGVLLYLALVRGFSSYFFFGGTLFVLEGAFFLVGRILDLRIKEAWPITMIIAGMAGLAMGLWKWKALRARSAAPSLGFAGLGILFSLFSFRVIDMEFGRFIAIWWPSLIIVCGACLFVAYGIGLRARRAVDRHGAKPDSRPRDTDERAQRRP
jgi:hypothetical protein